MTGQQIDRRKIRRQAEEALRRERRSRVGPVVLNAALPTLPPEDVLALLAALDQAETDLYQVRTELRQARGDRDDADTQAFDAHQRTSEATAAARGHARRADKHEARLQAVHDLLNHADQGHRAFIETWDLRDALR